MLLTGRALGPYRILEKLGAGGMGEVYKAHDTRLNRTVAIKVLTPAIATPERLQRFEQEARAASALNHPNILTIHDVGHEGDIAYFAMEWVEGQTLRELIDRGRLPPRRILQIAQQIADGLAKAHAAGIVHRDLKPENVMITSDGFVKIVDFGIAKLTERNAEDLAATMTQTARTVPGVVLGTVGYMSPEQASGRPVDYRSDQFSLGLLMYELATGSRPFDRPTTAQSLAATIEAEPTPVQSLNPEIPPHLALIVERCLAKHPGDRYESTRDLARDLKMLLDTRPAGTAVVTPAHRGRRALYATVAVLVLLAGAGTAAYLWTRWRPVPAAAQPLVAVRPFKSLSADPAQGYFAVGIADEIRGQLSQVSSLRLVSRNALDLPAGADVVRAVRDLGVTQLVDGSVRIDGTRVRISAELVDASTQQTLWSDQYDRELADVLAVQADVALQIARALRANLSKDEQQRLEQRPTTNAEAYELYLRSQQLPVTDRAKNLAAIDLLRQALKLDPQFAQAQARIAYRYIFMGYYDEASNIDKGLLEAEAALRINPLLPYAHFALGSGYGMKGMDQQARLAFLRALELDPNNGSAMANLSVTEYSFGRLGESLSWARRMFALSGKKGNDFYHVAGPLMTLRPDDALRRWLVEGDRRYPNFQRIEICLATLDLYQGRTNEVSARMASLVARLPGDEEVKFARADLAFLTGSDDLVPALEAIGQGADTSYQMVAETIRLRRAYVASSRGDRSRADRLLTQIEQLARGKIDRGDRRPALRVELAAAAVLRGDSASAIEWLQRAYDAGYRDYGILERDPILARIEPAAKLRGVLDQMKRDVDVQRSRAEEQGLLNLDALLAPAK
jgi:eukaryotic-like serine/threonine-protein kinase